MGPWLETIAVVFALLYLVLVIRQNIWCWGAALVSTSIYVYVFVDAGLYMESGLQVFYIVMALYGWWQWRGGASGSRAPIIQWRAGQHALALSIIVGLSILSGALLSRYTSAALPFIDSLTTWGGVVATYMVARKVFENWHYWFVIDSISIYLYLSRGLTQTAVLFVLYLVMVVVGYVAWRKALRAAPEGKRVNHSP